MPPNCLTTGTVENCAACTGDGASCNQCLTGFTAYQATCRDEQAAFEDVSLRLIGKVVVLESQRIFDDYKVGWAGTDSGISASQAAGYAATALLREFKDVFDLVYVFTCKTLPRNGGADYSFHGEGRGLGERAQPTAGRFKGCAR